MAERAKGTRLGAVRAENFRRPFNERYLLFFARWTHRPDCGPETLRFFSIPPALSFQPSGHFEKTTSQGRGREPGGSPRPKPMGHSASTWTTYPSISSCIHSPNCPSSQSSIHPATHLPFCPPMISSTYPSPHPPIPPFVHPTLHKPTLPYVHSLTSLFILSFTHQ